MITSDNQAEIIDMYNHGADDEEIAEQLGLSIEDVADAIDAYDKGKFTMLVNDADDVATPLPSKSKLVSNLRMFILLCIANCEHNAIYELFEDGCTQELRDQIYSLADPKSPEPFRSAMINMGFPDY